jgi:putative ABC transport system permease protein
MPLFHAIDQDIRQAFRGFASGRSFTIAVAGSLALGIAATTTAFALVNAALFRPFPEIRAQEELVRITLGPRQRVWIPTTWEDYQVLRQGVAALDDLSLAHDARFVVAAEPGAAPQVTGGLVVSGNYFDVLGVQPALGRFFAAEEDGVPWARPAVVVSHAYWQRHLSGDPAVLQRALSINGVSLPIVGIAPEGFVGAYRRADVQLWITFALSDLVFRDAKGRPIQASSAAPFLTTMVGRLKPAATIEQAQAQGAALALALAGLRDRGLKELFVRVEPLRIVDPVTYAPRAFALIGVPLIVLAIACVNAANLLLARATRRRRDWVVRMALGAGRWRLVRQLLVESLLLALGGGAVGLVLTAWTRQFVQNQVLGEVVIDTNVLVFVVAAAVATALAFGLGPALSVTRAAVSRAPQSARRGPFGSRTRSVLVAMQAALCLGLLATGAQFTTTVRALSDDGLPEPAQFLSLSLNLDPLRYGPLQADAFYSALLERVRELPGVGAAALSNRTAAHLLAGLVASSGPQVAVPGRPDVLRRIVTTYATAGIFETVGLPVLQGRTFSAEEHRRPPRAVVVNEAFAQSVFGGDALGRVVTLTERNGGDIAAVVEAMVVGVVATARERPMFSLPMVYYPAPLTHEPALDVFVRFEGSADAIGAALRTIVSTQDARIPVGQIITGEELRRRRNLQDYTQAQVLSILGVVALVLAAAGLYGVASYMVMLRQKEIGIRMALGAQEGSVLRLVIRQSMAPVLAGCVLGAAGAVIVGSLVRSRLYGVSPMDPAAFGGAALLLIATMIVASFAPARRASRVDPIEVLRAD